MKEVLPYGVVQGIIVTGLDVWTTVALCELSIGPLEFDTDGNEIEGPVNSRNMAVWVEHAIVVVYTLVSKNVDVLIANSTLVVIGRCV